MDPELREALNQVVVDLRGEIRSGDAETREALGRLGADLRGEMQTFATELRGEIQTAAAETRTYVDDRLQTTTVEMRRHFEVVGESIRSDIRAVAEGLALVNQRMDRRDNEQTGRTDGLEGRVVRLEVRVKSLEDDRKPRRRR